MLNHESQVLITWNSSNETIIIGSHRNKEKTEKTTKKSKKQPKYEIRTYLQETLVSFSTNIVIEEFLSHLLSFIVCFITFTLLQSFFKNCAYAMVKVWIENQGQNHPSYLFLWHKYMILITKILIISDVDLNGKKVITI